MPATVRAEDVSFKTDTTVLKGKDGKQYFTSFWDAYKAQQGEGNIKDSAKKTRQAFQFSDLLIASGKGSLALGTAAGIASGGVAAGAGLAIGAVTGATAYMIEWIFATTETYEWKDATGNTYKFQIDSSGDAVFAPGSVAGWQGCEILPAKLYKYRECMFCPLFKVIYVAADDITAMSINTLSSGFAVVMGLGLAIFIAIQTLAHVSSLTKQDAPKFLDTLIRQTFKFFIAFLLLHFHSQMFSYIILPILKTGLTMGRSFLISDSDAVCELIEIDPVNVAAYGQELYSNLACYITVIQREIGFMQAIGSSLLCIGGHTMMRADFGDGFQMAVVGFILATFGFLLSIAFAFYLVDAVVQLGIVGALLPFLIASWPFKATAKYANTGFQMLLNSAFIFVFMGLVVSVNLKLVGASIDETEQTSIAERLQSIAGKANDENKDGSFNFNQDAINNDGALKITNDDQTYVQMGGLSSLYIAINAQNLTELKTLTDISGLNFLIMVFCCIFGFKFTQQAQALADKMASGSVSGIAPSIATMGGSAAMGMAKKATQSTREAAERKVKQGVGAVYGKAKSLFSRNRGRSTSGSGFGKGEAPTVFNQGGTKPAKPNGRYGSGNNDQQPITINQNSVPEVSTPLQPKNLAEKKRMEKRFAREFDKSENHGKLLDSAGLANSQAGGAPESKKMLRRMKAKSRDAYVKARMDGKSEKEAFNAASQAYSKASSEEIQKITGINVDELITNTQQKKNPPKKLNKKNGSKKGNSRVGKKGRKHSAKRG